MLTPGQSCGGQEAVLGGLHERHPGIVCIKRLARGYVWWPAMEFNIEDKVKGCGHCQPDRPWAQDYAGPFSGRMFLIMVDAHSKWQKYMLFRLQDQQYCHTRPTENNGFVFTSSEFESFCKKNGITNSPYHQWHS